MLAEANWQRRLLKSMEKTNSWLLVQETSQLAKLIPLVVEAMKEKGIDISQNKPKLISFQMANDSDLIVTMGCNDQGIYPVPFFKPTIDWKLEDPKGKPVDIVREIRD
jgi:arsenate reductase (thioredoxin)